MTVGETTLTLLLRALGLGLIALGPLHVVLWRVLDWRGESRKLTPLNARVFLAHVATVVFVVVALGLLLLLRPELLVARSELARILILSMLVFFGVRLLAQLFYFDPVFALGIRGRTALRILASLGWLGCVLILALALAHQLRSEGD